MLALGIAPWRLTTNTNGSKTVAVYGFESVYKLYKIRPRDGLFTA